MDNELLGVIVDRSSFDEEDELGFGKDCPSVIEEERSLPDNGGVVMKNGKVRRKLRWKPPNFRRKKNVSSNMSVISALTNRSSATNRSISTTRSTKSFLSHFSRKSQNSFHTFHSTETPVATNKANSPQFPHAMQRPNYPDTFDTKHSTIDTEGRHAHRRIGSDNALQTVDEVAHFERSSTLPSRLDGMPQSPSSPMTDAPMAFCYGSSGISTTSDPFDSLEIGPPEPVKKAKRPPLFKRKLKKSKARPPSPADTSQASSTSSPVVGNHTAPTLASSGSPLSQTVSVQRENSCLPMLELENYEEDRRVAMCAGTPPRSEQDHADEPVNGDDATAGSVPRSPIIHQHGSSSVPSSPVPTTTENYPFSTPPRSGRPITGPHSRPSSPATPPVTRPQQSASPSSRPSPSPTKRYNRPVDSTITPPTNGAIMADGGDGIEAQQKSPSRRSPTNITVPIDLDDGAFFEAENNLRAIHDMAAEHMAHGEYEEAIEVFEEILRGQQERYGQNHYRVGTALHNFGIVQLRSGDYKKAIEICSQAVQVRKESLVPDHPDVAVSLAQLGVAHLESQNYEDALVAFREALHIRRNFLGPRHPKCAKILNNIGCAQYSLDELESSRLTFEEALDIQRDTLRKIPSSEDVQDSTSAQTNTILLSMASTLCNIGSIKLRRGLFEEAGVALEEALLIQQSVLGDDHPMVASTMESIEFVENAQESAIPSAKAFLKGWSDSNDTDDLEQHENLMMCTQPNIEDILSLDVFTSLSPQKWFKQMGDAITQSACVQTLRADDATAPLDQTNSLDQDKEVSGRFSV